MALSQRPVAFQSYHDWTTKDRKRPVGTILQSHPGDRSKRAKWSTSAGIQARRTGAPELIQVEMEPGRLRLIRSQLCLTSITSGRGSLPTKGFQTRPSSESASAHLSIGRRVPKRSGPSL